MNFLNIFNWLKLNTILPSFLFKNRIVIVYAKNLKKIFNMLGFTYKNNMWYVEKFNNILNLLTITRLVNWLSCVIFGIFLIRILDLKSDIFIVELVNVIDTVEILTSSIIFLIYWLFIFFKIKLVSLFTTNNTKYLYKVDAKPSSFKLNINFFDISEKSDINTLFTNLNIVEISKLYGLLYKCNTTYIHSHYSFNNIYNFIIKSDNNISSSTYKYSNLNLPFKTWNILFNEQSLKYNTLVNISNDKYGLVKSFKITKWLFNYFGSNKNNYSYLYNINMKFNHLKPITKLNKMDIFHNKTSSNGILQDLPVSNNVINNYNYFNEFLVTNRFIVNNNFFILNKMSTLFNLTNNNSVLKDIKLNRSNHDNQNVLNITSGLYKNKQALMIQALMSVNIVNFDYCFNTNFNYIKTDIKEIRKLFFFK